MNKYYYDLHIHSCLSPCGDNDMTPNNIAGMAALNGLNIIALTDHNTTKNCPAFFKACKKYGIIPVAGMEMTTAEDIHVVALFPSLEDAMSFNEEYAEHRAKIKNKVEIFGDQLILDEEDNVIGTDEYLLLPATDLSIEEAASLARSYGAAVFPAHIDRQENGVIAVLGDLPDEPEFSCVEFYDKTKREEYFGTYTLEGKAVLTDSDAHYLWNINEAENYLMIDDEPYSSDTVRRRLIEMIKEGRI